MGWQALRGPRSLQVSKLASHTPSCPLASPSAPWKCLRDGESPGSGRPFQKLCSPGLRTASPTGCPHVCPVLSPHGRPRRPREVSVSPRPQTPAHRLPYFLPPSGLLLWMCPVGGCPWALWTAASPSRLAQLQTALVPVQDWRCLTASRARGRGTTSTQEARLCPQGTKDPP